MNIFNFVLKTKLKKIRNHCPNGKAGKTQDNLIYAYYHNDYSKILNLIVDPTGKYNAEKK